MEIIADRIPTLIECLYTKSAELRSVCVKFSLWSRLPVMPLDIIDQREQCGRDKIVDKLVHVVL